MAEFCAKWLRKTAEMINMIMTYVVFLIFDLLDFLMCIFFRYVDSFLEGKPTTCYCGTTTKDYDERNIGVSDTLFSRKNVFREIMGWKFDDEGSKKSGSDDLRKIKKTKWSDCGCETCVSWMNLGGDLKLHVDVQEPSIGNQENVIFLHGFISSSFLWTNTVFPQLAGGKYRLFAVDLLGFGSSPKPQDCLYTLNDHVEMIEKSVIREFDLKSFHMVAHSMGCIIALALAAKYLDILKSITLIAPPYFLSSKEDDPSDMVLKRLACKTLWPPLLYGAAFMTWYEHLGRCVCCVVCRNHRIWEKILKLVTRERKLSFLVMDITRHTHHSAFHTMHNVICGGAKMMDPCLKILRQSQARVTVLQGSRDEVVPLECSNNIKVMVPNAEVKIIDGANHRSVIIGREKQFAADLELIWDSVTNATG